MERLVLMVLLAMAAFGAGLPTRGTSQFYPAEGRFYTAARGRPLRPTGILAPGHSTYGVAIYPTGGDQGRVEALLFEAGLKAGLQALWYLSRFLRLDGHLVI